MTAMLNPSLPAGVVAARLDWAKLHPEGANVNVLTSERLTDIGGGATFYSVLVEVAKTVNEGKREQGTKQTGHQSQGTVQRVKSER